MADITEAIQKIKSGDRPGGAVILKQLIQENKNNERAWLWMSVCVQSPEEKRKCLNEVLRIDPNHEKAKAALAKLEEPDIEDIAKPAANTISCPNCGAIISATAMECPYCHQVPNKAGAVGHQLVKLGWSITQLTILIPIIVVICFCLYAVIFSGAGK